MAGSSKTTYLPLSFPPVGRRQKKVPQARKYNRGPKSQLETRHDFFEEFEQAESPSIDANERTWDSIGDHSFGLQPLPGPEVKSKKASRDLNPTEKDKHEVQNVNNFEILRNYTEEPSVCIFLPTKHRTREVVSNVQSFCDLVVKVKAGSAAESGWVKHILFTSGPCPCRLCIKSFEPKSGWYQICVVTPQKVFGKTREAWSADVEFSLSDGKTFTSTGMEIVREYEDGPLHVYLCFSRQRSVP